VWETHAIIAQDTAFQNYLEYRNRPLGERTIASAKSAVRDFLTYLGTPITTTALSELIRKTRADHRNEDFTTDRKLTAFGRGPPSTNGRYVRYLKRTA